MLLASFIRLLTLAAIWGGSFLFMRIAANPLGPVALVEARVLLAAVILYIISCYLKKHITFKANIKHFFILGFFNSALPFLLFAYAAQALNASLLAIFNSTAPIWGAIIGAVWTRSLISKTVSLGLVLGIMGVCVLVGYDASIAREDSILFIIAAIMAAFSYGVATNYAKNAAKVSAFDNAHGSMWASAIIIIPLLPFFPLRESPGLDVSISIIMLGVVCTGIAYLLYFRLVTDLGATSALSVTFLIPVFGILWGYIFLGETIGVNTIFGAALVILGTMLVTGFSPKYIFKKKALLNE